VGLRCGTGSRSVVVVGIFGGQSEDELRATGTPTSARVTYVDDTGKRRDGGAFARVKVRVQIDSGSARGRELDRAKWVPANRLPRVGDNVQIRFDPDDVGDWAWGDAAMYAPPAAAAPSAPAAPIASDAPGDVGGLQGVIAQAFAQGNVSVEHSNRVIDLTGSPELREQILGQLRAHGVDFAAVQSTGGAAGTDQDADETAVKLRQLDDLHRQGILSDAEHREQRQRIIDSI
jgi:hypothetical protein